MEDKKEDFLEDLNVKDKDFLLQKFNEADEEKLVDVEENKKFYYAGIRRLFVLIQKLNPTEKENFWKEVKMDELIFDINNITTLTSLLIKFFFQIDCEAAALDLIIKDYFNRIYKRIKREK